MTQKAPVQKPISADEIRAQHEINGARRANTNLLMYALEQLKPGDERTNVEKIAALTLEREEALAGLRRLAELYGDGDWPEGLSLQPDHRQVYCLADLGALGESAGEVEAMNDEEFANYKALAAMIQTQDLKEAFETGVVEIERLRAVRMTIIEAVAKKRIESLRLRGGEDDWHAGRFKAFTEVLRLLASRVTPEDFATATEFLAAAEEDNGDL